MMPARFSTVVLLLSCASALVLDSSVWGPADSVHALDAVITAVNSIVKNPHLAPEHLKRAKEVAEDVTGDVEAVESGKLTKQQAKDKVGAAMKELVSLEAEFSKPTANAAKLATLQKELAEKQKALAKVESMMKLLKLKKALAEKKMMLEKLVLQKSEAKGGKNGDEETGEVASKLLAMAKNMSKADTVSSMKTIAAALQAREHAVSDSLTKMTAEQANAEAQIDAIVKAHEKEETSKATQSKMTEFDAKKQNLFKNLKKQETRKFAKFRAVKQSELKELKDAEKSTEERDVGSLIKVLTKMQREHGLKKGDFLH